MNATRPFSVWINLTLHRVTCGVQKCIIQPVIVTRALPIHWMYHYTNATADAPRASVNHYCNGRVLNFGTGAWIDNENIKYVRAYMVAVTLIATAVHWWRRYVYSNDFSTVRCAYVWCEHLWRPDTHGRWHFAWRCPIHSDGEIKCKLSVDNSIYA